MRKSICAVLPFFEENRYGLGLDSIQVCAMLMQAAVLYFRTYAEQCVHAGVVAA